MVTLGSMTVSLKAAVALVTLTAVKSPVQIPAIPMLALGEESADARCAIDLYTEGIGE